MTDDVAGAAMGIFSQELILRGNNVIEMKAVAERESQRSLHFSFMFISGPEPGSLQIVSRGKDMVGAK
jgi:hypothetical protein